MRVLFIGDIVGKVGRMCVKNLLPRIRNNFKLTYVIANGENAAGGFGINEKVARELFGFGIDLITSGNHIWDKKEAVTYLAKEDRVLRPLNYPPGVPGHGSKVLNSSGKPRLGIINLSGRVFMHPLDDPFRMAIDEVDKMKDDVVAIIIDFHAEATSEKIAFGHYLDGKVSAVIGTHTHVQTADEKILGKGTAYITDIGMTGPANSVIGVETDMIIDRFLTFMPKKFNTAKGDGIFSGVIVDIDEKSGQATAIQRVQLTYP